MGRTSPAPHPGRASVASLDPHAATAEIARLEALDLAALRVAFRNRTGRIAPARIARTLLVRVLVYRIQAERFGDLRPETRRMLDAITVAAGSASSGSGGAAAPAVPVRDGPKEGILVEVTVQAVSYPKPTTTPGLSRGHVAAIQESGKHAGLGGMGGGAGSRREPVSGFRRVHERARQGNS